MSVHPTAAPLTAAVPTDYPPASEIRAFMERMETTRTRVESFLSTAEERFAAVEQFQGRMTQALVDAERQQHIQYQYFSTSTTQLRAIGDQCCIQAAPFPQIPGYSSATTSAPDPATEGSSNEGEEEKELAGLFTSMFEEKDLPSTETVVPKPREHHKDPPAVATPPGQ